MLFYETGTSHEKVVWYSIAKDLLYLDMDKKLEVVHLDTYSPTEKLLMISSDNLNISARIFRLQNKFELWMDNSTMMDLDQLHLQINFDQKFKLDVRTPPKKDNSALVVTLIILGAVSLLAFALGGTALFKFCKRRQGEQASITMMNESTADFEHDGVSYFTAQ